MKSAAQSFSLKEIQQTVQHNCAISDARYSREYSLCIYLLRLREFYRWKNKIPLGASIDQKKLGSWVSETETFWDDIEETDYLPLNIGGETCDPFDAELVNRQLKDSGLHYSAGLGRLGQPHFLLAKELTTTHSEQFTCVECGEELARDIITLPAMAQNKTIYLRRESLNQLLWQMYDEWNINKAPGPMARLVERYSISNDKQLDHTLNAASTELSKVLIHHELGEIAAGDLLGNDYQQMTVAFHGKPGEMQIRAVRDLLADSLCTWPLIAGDGKANKESLAHLDFWLTNLQGYREIIFKLSMPDDSLFSEDAHSRFQALTDMIDSNQKLWKDVGLSLTAEYQKHGINFDVEKSIRNFVESSL